MALTENDIIDIIYSLYETDTDGWGTGDDEYLAARKYCNVAISRWEKYDNTVWRELWTKLSDASDGDTSLTAGTYAYDCPSDFIRSSSWVRTGDTPTFWQVIDPSELADHDLSNDTSNFCYFTGNPADGYDLNFNPNVTLTTGDTIYYEYYKTASLFSATTSTTEMSDPYFIIYYVLARFLKNDGEDYEEEANQADDLLENMRVMNMSGFAHIPNPIQEAISGNSGFGY